VLAALALELDHPVRMGRRIARASDRRGQARDHHYRVTAYATPAGRILGIDAELIVDAGAYAMWPNGPFMETGMAARNLVGPYDIRHYRVRTWTVATNKAPLGPYRGVARPGACFAIERTIDEVARAAGRDPLELRLETLVRPDQMPYETAAGMVFDNGDYAASARLCAALLDLPAVAGAPASRRAGRPAHRRRLRRLCRADRPWLCRVGGARSPIIRATRAAPRA